MGKRWYQEHKSEHYYRKAKRDNYRSRASYKLMQIDERHNVIVKGDTIVDLGAAPGGWSQVAIDLVGEGGFVVGVDLDSSKPMDGWHFIQGDATKSGTIEEIWRTLEENDRWDVDVVLSDMSPNITGRYSVDQANSVYLAQIALGFCEGSLKQDGNFICKIFQGEDTEEFLADVRAMFKSVKRYSPKASRKSSSEIYVIAKYKRQDPTR